MAKSKNTITNVEKERVEMLSNAIEILSKFTDAFTKNDLTVNLTLKNSAGEDVDITLPNLYALDSDIKRLDQNINALSGIDSTAYIQQADGKYNRIFSAKRNVTPSTINNLQVPVNFNRKNNWFFENFLTPLLYIDFDLSSSIDEQIRKVAVKRIIINTNDATQEQVFDTSLKGRSDLNYEDVILFLSQQGISYFADDDIYDLPPSILRYEGSFGVLKSFDSYDSNLQRNVKYYQLANVDYTDNLASYKNSVSLKVGDILSLNDSCKFEILTIDIASRQVTLKRLSGKDNIPIGDNVLKLESKKYTSKNISVNVGYGEKQVIFVKPINTEFNLTTTSFSNGVCFNSNELVLKDGNGNNISLEDYYSKEVTDFGMQIMNLSKERSIPATFGNIPNVPTVKAENFQVVQINTHLEQDKLTKNIKTKSSEKIRLKNEIENLDREIAENNKKLQSTNYSSSERKQLETKIDSLVNSKRSKLSEYTSILTDLNNIAKDNNIDNIKPKYRVRGFWDYPTPVKNTRTGDEHVVQFVIQYRYLNTSGAAPNLSEIKYTTNSGNESTGVFSNWVELKTKPRDKYYDLDDGIFLWNEDKTDDQDKVNSNQLDIPIKPGESVEIRIKSISEAGYPTNPLSSNYSNPITITFPDGLNADVDLYSLLEDAAREEERSFIYKQIQEYGLERHFRTTLIEKNRYFAHAAYDLFSGFTDSTGTSLSVYDKLRQLEDEIASMKTQLNTQTPIEIKNGKMAITVLGKDSTGSLVEYPIQNNGTLDLDLPSYYSEISKLPLGDRRGAIIRQEYKIKIANRGDGILYLNSKYPGSIGDGLPKLQGSNLTWKGTSLFDDDYRNNKLYNKVPIRYKGYDSYEDIKDYQSIFGYSHQQSSQVAGQFIYSRYKDITGVKSLYGTGGVLQALNTDVSPAATSNKRTFVWDYTWYDPTTSLNQLNPYSMAPNGGGMLSDFCVHINHIDLKENRKMLYDLQANDVLTRENLLEHSKYFNIESGSADYNKQNEVYVNTSGKFAKFGFYENDRFLIGKNTTGMYFYMNPDTPQSIRVVGNDSQSSLALNPGDSIIVPLVVEYRMTDFYDEADNYVVNKQINVNDLNIADLTPRLKINENSISSLHLNNNYVTGKQFLGIVGGYSEGNVNRKNLNITYEKTLGFDIFSKNNPTFSFDIKAKVAYGSTKNSITLDTTQEQLNDITTTDILNSSKSTVVIDSSLLNNGNNSLI